MAPRPQPHLQTPLLLFRLVIQANNDLLRGPHAELLSRSTNRVGLGVSEQKQASAIRVVPLAFFQCGQISTRAITPEPQVSGRITQALTSK